MWRKIREGGLDITPNILRLWHVTKAWRAKCARSLCQHLAGKSTRNDTSKTLHWNGTEQAEDDLRQGRAQGAQLAPLFVVKKGCLSEATTVVEPASRDA